MLKRWFYFAIVLLAAAILLSAWANAHRDTIKRQWGLYCIGASADLEEARKQIAWFEAEPDRAAKLDELVRNWQTGNPRFDLFLTETVRSPEASDELRAAFAAELSRRDGLLAPWAHFWRWKAPADMSPQERIASILGYLDDRIKLDPPPALTWRETLDLMAVWQSCSREDLARGLTADNWGPRWRVWQETRPAVLPEAARPDSPLPIPR